MVENKCLAAKHGSCCSMGAGEDYCLYHKPNKSKDEAVVFYEKLKEQATAETDENGDEKPVFNDEVNWKGYIFPSIMEANFADATFKGEANFEDATFKGEVIFLKAIFEGEVYFAGATFKGGTTFLATTFECGANFGRTIFGGEASFGLTNFGGEANFGGTTFDGRAYFTYAIFGGGANFERTTFGGGGSFMSTAFEDKANFLATIFRDRAYFLAANFKGRTIFERATFEGGADFTSTTFEDKSNLTSFWCATFNDGATFLAAIFEGGVDFESAIFEGGADFEGAIFEGVAVFVSTTFGDKANFKRTTFRGRADFKRATFEGEALFLWGTCVSDTSFSGALFERTCTFAYRTFYGKLKLTNTDFRQGVVIEYDWEKPEPNKYRLPQAEQEGCRVQRIAYEKEGRKDAADAMFVREMRASRRDRAIQYQEKDGILPPHSKPLWDSKKPLLSKFCWGNLLSRLSNKAEYLLVDLASQYGTSWQRLISTALVLIVMFACLYLTSAHLSITYPHVGGIYSTQPTAIELFVNLESGNEAITVESKTRDIVMVKNFINLLYYSFNTFIPVGYGEMYPVGLMKYVAGTQSLIGAFYIALFVVVFARRWMR